MGPGGAVAYRRRPRNIPLQTAGKQSMLHFCRWAFVYNRSCGQVAIAKRSVRLPSRWAPSIDS
eukprot:3814331-Alexandrium_andersonii.AAC.1